jgi:glycosyltransferase involved in cell wall biosynthesis
MARILLLEPFFGGSHRAFAEGLARSSRHKFELLTAPGRFWRWRMRGAAIDFARRARAIDPPDLLFASSMLSLAEFLGLAPDGFRTAPRVLYFHENQLTYPLPENERRDLHVVLTEIASALAANRILFNSEHHRRELLAALPGFLRALPDRKPTGIAERFRALSSVLSPGIDFASLGTPRKRERRRGEQPVLLWNHRWEHDKGRDLLLDLLHGLERRRVRFRLIVTGAPRGARTDLFEDLPRAAGGILAHVGFARTRAAYARLLARADLVVSTARHEFFGISVLEAIHAGAFPLLPKKLSYPEILPPLIFEACYYESPEELLDRAEQYLREGPPPVPGLREAAAPFAWPTVARRFDALFDELLGERASGSVIGTRCG